MYEIFVLCTNESRGFVYASSMDDALDVATILFGDNVGVYDHETGWFLG